ncbi:hypothetical protein BBK14_33965 [Parafrankia soli]|uniref:Uncharacterized protein n=1 Tax=Parafrankia soli TaxID=2599596 RepID=A0A1S1Q7F7_9ACTN|nr:hypothetical protein [Parafrankia soli]OHV30803.1 hypothetical protein BBK14_33965 [Parafrankia soli]
MTQSDISTVEWVPGVHVLVEDDTETCGHITRQTAPGRYLLTPGADGDPDSFEAVVGGAPNPDGLPVITQDADLDHNCPHEDGADDA